MKYVAGNREGLGSRLKCLISVMRLNGKPLLYWEKNGKLNCKWGDLFENSFKTIRRPHKKDPGFDVYYSWRWKTTTNERRKWGLKYYDFMYHDTPKSLRSGILKQINQLKPVECVRNEIDTFKRQFSKNTISVCVRTWKDVVGSPKERRFDLKEVTQTVDKNIKSNIFLTSDSVQVYHEFVGRYGKNNVLYYPKRTGWGDRHSTKGMQDTLVELYLAGLNRKMFITWHSAFTECQWWFGGGKAEVTEMVKW